MFTSLRDMLRFERQVVCGLTTTKRPERRAGVAEFVDGALRSMPEHLRAAIGGRIDRSRRSFAALGGRPTARSLDTSPIPQLRQYVRVFRSLVLFAEQELPVSSTAVLVAS